MFIDIVCPDGNEDEFAQVAARLGHKILFLYAEKRQMPGRLCGVYTRGGKYPSCDLLVGPVSEVEHPLVKAIFIETIGGKDKTHQRTSGLNHVICAEARRREKMIVFDFNSLLRAKDRPEVLGRMMQNAMLCRKFKNEVIVASFARAPYEMRSSRDLRGFMELLGFSAVEAKGSIGSLSLLLKR
jgi:hypothetical protein